VLAVEAIIKGEPVNLPAKRKKWLVLNAFVMVLCLSYEKVQ